MLNLDYKDVAEKYGGNKQRIAEAAALGALGPEGPLLAVSAGMYIDRMRAAQMQEQAPQQTVAQQVLSSPAPQQAPPQQGLGAIPPQQATPPMQAAPPMEGAMPPEAGLGALPTDGGEMPTMAEGGMVPPYAAGGGLSDLPLPDTMFDEPSNGGFNDGYAGGGLVAFAGGGTTFDDFSRVIPAQESSGRYTARNRKSGALGKYQLMPSTAKALAARLGLPYDPNMLAADTPEARQYQDALGNAAMKEAWDYGKGDAGLAALYYHGGPNQSGWGANTKKYREDILSRLGRPKLEEQNMETPEGRYRSLEDQIRSAKNIFADLPDAGVDEAIDYYRKQKAPEKQAKDRKYDMWSTLAQIGASMASTDSPSFLQAAGKAMAAAIPGAIESKRERDKAERDAVNAIAEFSGVKRKTAKEALDFGKEAHAIEMGAEGAETERKFRATEAEKARTFAATEAEKERAGALALAKVRQNPSDMESAMYVLQNGTPAQKAALEEYFKLKGKYAGSAPANMFGVPPGTQTASGAGADQGTYLGTIGG